MSCLYMDFCIHRSAWCLLEDTPLKCGYSYDWSYGEYLITNLFNEISQIKLSLSQDNKDRSITSNKSFD